MRRVSGRIGTLRGLVSEVRALLLPGGALRFLRDLLLWSVIGLVIAGGMLVLVVVVTY